MPIFGYLIGVLVALNPFTWLDDALGAADLLSQWLPFFGKPEGNAHARYNSPYTSMTGNTKSAVQLGYEHLIELGNNTSTKLNLFSFDGTASMGGSWTPADLFSEPGGAYPQILGKRLQDTNPAKWVWQPIDYHPEYVLYGEPAVFGTQIELTDGPLPVLSGIIIPTIGKNIERAVKMAYDQIVALPAGEKIVLSGLSQGTFAVRALYDEFRFGALQSRRADLAGIVNFGDACRPHGWTVPLAGAIDPGGEGVCKLPMWLPISQQWTLTGLIADPEALYWAFTNLTDAASTQSSGTVFAGKITGLLCKALLYGPPPAATGWGNLTDWTTRTDYTRFINVASNVTLANLESTPAKVDARRANRSAVDRAALAATFTDMAPDLKMYWYQPPPVAWQPTLAAPTSVVSTGWSTTL